MSNPIGDVRYALRMLAKNPGFTLVAVATLTIGIGANTAIFSAIDAVLLHPLTFPDASQLVSITKDMPMFELVKANSSPLDFLDYRSHSTSFSGMAAIEANNFNLTGGREPERVGGMRASANLFSLLGAAPIFGRAFSVDEEQTGKDHVVILSEALWKRRFGGDSRILGSQIQIEGENYTVVGITRPILQFVGAFQLWMPLAFSPKDLDQNARGHQFLMVMARMKPGVTLAQANADLKVAASRMTKERADWYPKGWSVDAEPLAQTVAAPLHDSLLILIGAVALVLLIGCVNVANLLLARANSREKEIGIRTALGASRRRIVGQLLTEGSIVSMAAAGLGILSAAWALDLFERFGPSLLLRGQRLEIDWFICGFAVAVSLVSTLIFALAPAIAASKTDVNEALKERSRTSGAPKSRMRDALVTAEVALSLVLLICAGLLVRSFQALEQAKTGFSPDHVLTLNVSLPVAEYPKPQDVSGFHGRLLARIASLPGVSATGAVNNLPFDGNNSGGSFDIVGRKWPASEPQPDVSDRSITPGYFSALRIPVLRGRPFAEQDGFAAPKVAIVDEPFVRRFFPNENPIGQKIERDGQFTIIGVVGAIKKTSLSVAPTPTIYFPDAQKAARGVRLVIRTAGMDPLALVPAIRREMSALDRDLPVFGVLTMNGVLENSLARGRFATTLIASFAVIALLLAAIGIYGVVSYTVGRRSQEIGIRMALGAQAGDAVRLILKQGMLPVFIGIAVGFVVSLAATRAMAKAFYGVSPSDPVTFIVLSGTLAFIAALASYIPARRATRIDPVRALRSE
jgi:putative ABC transport system permease protein